jgi:MFS transporter, DHA1 family, multidrug resistance protein
MPETLPAARRNREPMIQAFSTYGQLLANRKLLAYAGAGGFFYGGMYAYIAGTPFAYIDYHHVSPQFYGLLFGVGIAGIMTTNLINARLVRRLGSDRLLRVGGLCAAASGITVAICAGLGWGGLAGLVVPLFLFVSSTGFIVANSISGALNLFPRFAGSVSALIGATQYGTGILGSALVGALADGTPAPLGRVVAFCGVGCAYAALSLARRSSSNCER